MLSGRGSRFAPSGGRLHLYFRRGVRVYKGSFGDDRDTLSDGVPEAVEKGVRALLGQEKIDRGMQKAFPRDKPSGLGQESNGVGRYGGGSFDGGIREEEIMSVSTTNITDSELFRRKNMTPEWREEFCERWREIQEIFRREAEREATENDYGGNEKRS